MGDGSAQDTNWPLPKFHFSVDLPPIGTGLPFQEVSGLDTESQVIEYRHSTAPKPFSTIKMPGLIKSSNVTLKKGIFAGDNNFWTWYDTINMNTIKRETVIIKLLDETGTAQMTWTLNNAFPCKITGTDMKSDSNEVAVESIEIAFETLVIANPG